MALRALQGPTGGGTPVGGTGTPNTIPRWTGPSTLGDSLITQDTNARAIGVATASLAPWGSAYRAIQIGQSAAIMSAAAAANDVWYVSNGYWDGSVFRYTATGPALAYSQTSTGHQWIYAASGTAGTAFSFTNGMILNTSGFVGIGTASPASRLDVAGTITCDDAGTGLKLPATPGNADTQTLDAYREDTFTTSFSGLGNCSNVSASNLRFTQIGRLVTIEGTLTFTVTAATTQTNFNFTLPSGRNRGSTANAGCGIGVDNASTFTGAIWNASGDATTAAIYFGPTNPFGAGTVRTVPFSYSYYTAT